MGVPTPPAPALEVVRKEAKREKKGLDLTAATRLSDLLDRIAEDRALPGDVKTVKGPIREARLSSGGVTFRLLFVRLGSTQVLLALHMIGKKSRKLPPQAIDVASSRLADWRRREGDE